ncbi:hypothetical protein ERO13_D09G250300v2 [Gossypium hirsutum]|nr:hypothetical protein ERO13_D09G250300v2 [Gossypium hirsutum]
MPLFGWFHQMRNRDSVLNALNGHFDHGRTEIKKILPKISFTISLQMRSKLLLLSQHYTFRPLELLAGRICDSGGVGIKLDWLRR